MNKNISIDAYTVNMLFSKHYNVEPLKKEQKKELFSLMKILL